MRRISDHITDFTIWLGIVAIVIAAVTYKSHLWQKRWVGEAVVAQRLPSRVYPPGETVFDARGVQVTETGPIVQFIVVDGIELGLRNDGVVVWRDLSKTK